VVVVVVGVVTRVTVGAVTPITAMELKPAWTSTIATVIASRPVALASVAKATLAAVSRAVGNSMLYATSTPGTGASALAIKVKEMARSGIPPAESATPFLHALSNSAVANASSMRAV
jgi:hypothetical protein